ncbi:MAG: hypothetical protein C0401_12775, partial [Anaerolinea sp.]|nr:hypothetical protein [Anaerolinea sp.]
MSLGGWSRLGIVASAILGVVVFIVAYEQRPKLEDLQESWFFDAAVVLSDAFAEDGMAISKFEMFDELRAGRNNVDIATWLEAVASNPTEHQKKYSDEIARV